MRYEGRPGLSPAIAALIAHGDIAKEDVILDVGCGKGTDALLLARWGFRHVVGVDPDSGAIRIARARATRLRLGRRVRFFVGGPEDLPPDLANAGVDVVLHTLVGNNLDADYHSHFKAIARALKPKGLLVASIRTFRHEENAKPGGVPPVPGMRRFFDLTPSVSSHLAEHGDYLPPFAPVAIWIGRPRRPGKTPRRQ
jgi:SAM-dependent methyltransferase